jgi:hypothetical protein
MQGQRIGPITVLNTIQTSTTKPTIQRTQAYGMSLRFPQLCSHHNRVHIQHLQTFTTKPTVQHMQAYGMSNRFPTCEPTTIGYPFLLVNFYSTRSKWSLQGCVDSQESLAREDRPWFSGTTNIVTWEKHHILVTRNNTDRQLDRLINWQYLLPPI